ncbi:hypothetical protein [Caballeronia sp. dw_19]|uniref:hypothetical protein n=1 Tax=unclassified Caballeronia TaxID=2646786 RepID=UPI001BD308A8|nr:hypothetical protein [Caballeronia sp. dw_19]
MGATVLTGKRAGAFQRGNGEWIFALFERTYDKNCYPHRDHWSGITIGNYASVMRRVFRHARSCEGGMLQSRSGGIRSEHYIEAWRQELARPMVLNDREIDLRVGETFGAPIPKKALDDVRLCLANAGQHSRFDALVAGGLSVSLFADIDLLIALYGEEGPFSLWRVLSVDDCGPVSISASVPRLLPAAKVMDQMPDLRCHAIDGDSRLVSFDGQPWHHAGWQYSAVGSFITEVAYRLEMVHPGFAKRAIPEYRDTLRKASPVPPDTKLTVSRAPEGVDKWRLSTADEIAQGLGLVSEGEDAPATFSFEFSAITGENPRSNLYSLGRLAREQVKWEVPQTSEVSPGADETDASMGSQQLALVLP